MFLLKPKNIIKIIFHAVLVFSIFLILLINSFPWFLNIRYVQNRIFQIITNQTQLSINAKKIDFDLFPKVGLRFNDLAIKSKEGIEYSIKTILISPDFNKLIKGKPVIREIAILDSKLNLNLINNLSSKLSNNNSIEIPDIANLFLTNQLSKFIDKDKGLSILIKDFKQDFAEKIDTTLLIHGNNSVTGTISIVNFVLNKKLLKKYGFNENIFNFNSEQNGNLIHITNLKTDFHVAKDKTQVSIAPTLVDYPSMTLGIDFTHNKKTNKAQIEFSGHNVNINQVRKAYFDLFKKTNVSENLFDIVRAGNAPKITVLFKEKKLENLLSPENMILNGQLENGNIRIPNTRFIPRNVFGTAFIKNGTLYIKAEKGKLKNSSFNNGHLTIDLLNHDDHPFNGSFKVHAPVLDIQEILIESFKDSLLSEELKLVNNIKGVVDGELLLELKTGEDLNIIVVVKNTKVSGDYQRAPGKIKINMGRFQYKDNVVTLTDLAGKIGESYFYNFTGAYTLDDTSFIDIKSGKALVESKEVFDWLTGFKKIKSLVPNVNINKGYLLIDSTNIKGDIFKPDELEFLVQGSCKETLIRYDLIEHHLIEYNLIKDSTKTTELSLPSCNFQVSDKKLSIDKINAEISDIDIVKVFTQNQEIENITTPFTLSDASYESIKGNQLFKGKLNFSTGPEIDLYCQNNNKGKFSLKELTIKDKFKTDKFDKDNLKTDVTFAPDTKGNIDFFKFNGQINTRTFEKILKHDSKPYENLIGYTDKNNIIIKSNNNSTYSIFADTIDAEPFIKNFFLEYKNNLLTKQESKSIFPKTLIKLQANSLKYKQNKFTKFNTAISIKKDGLGLNGKFDLTTKDGNIYKFTLLSRILSVVNISTLFKGELPDITQHGFKYNSIKVKANIVNNKIVLEEALVDGHDMALVFKGTIDPVKNDLNLTCLVAPFKTIDMLIEKIPFISTILNNTLISIPVTISGKINDPKVIPLDPVYVGKGVINLMTNIIRTPFKLFKKIPGIGKKTSKDTTP